MLYIFSGLPGAGKTTLARQLAQEQRAVYLRVDVIEQALRAATGVLHGPEGYAVAYRVAESNLALGLPVVADTVNPLAITRAAWRGVAHGTGTPFVEIEIICSDHNEHRQRVETRTADIAGFPMPDWNTVIGRNYEPWETRPVVIDTAGRTVAQSFDQLRQAIATNDASNQPHG